MIHALIVGGGPAGSSCALWLTKLGFDVLLMDAGRRPGGLLHTSPNRNDWIVTQPGVTGDDLADGIELSLASAGVPLAPSCQARSVDRIPGGFDVTLALAGGRERKVAAAKLVIATGVKARTGGLAPSPRILIGPGEHVAQHDFKNLSVAILGGGDNAFENYMSVKAAGASRARIFARTVRAARTFIDKVPSEDVHVGVFTVEGDTCQVEGTEYDRVLVMYGWEPAPVFVTDLDLARTPQGFLQSDFVTCATSAEGVFAIGEVAGRGHPCVVTAMADGINAAKAIQRQLEG